MRENNTGKNVAVVLLNPPYLANLVPTDYYKW
jgi:hypothetical protein